MAKSCKEVMAANQRRSESEGHRFETVWLKDSLLLLNVNLLYM